MTLLLLLALAIGFVIGYWTARKVMTFNQPIIFTQNGEIKGVKRNVHLLPKQNGYHRFETHNN